MIENSNIQYPGEDTDVHVQVKGLSKLLNKIADNQGQNAKPIINSLASLCEGVDRQDSRKYEASLHRLGNLQEAFIKNNNKNYESSFVRSVASEKRQRAVNNAVYGKINKSISALDSLKEAFTSALDKLKDIIVDGIKDTLQSYSQNAAEMRKLNLTSQQKKDAGLFSSDVLVKVKDELGINADKENISKATNEVFAAGLGDKLLKLTETQRAYFAGVVEKAGLSGEKAFELVTTLENDTLKEIINRSSDPAMKQYIEEILKGLYTADANYAGGADAYANQFLKRIVEMEERVGTYFNDTLLTELAKTDIAVQTGNIPGIEHPELLAALGLEKGTSVTDAITTFLDSAREAAKSNDTSKLDELRNSLILMEQTGILSKEMVEALNKSFTALVKDPNADLGRNIRNEAENRDANETNSPDGTLKAFIDRTFSNVDVVTGGLLTDVSTGLDEFFGSSLPMQSIVSSGFKLVVGLLSSIAFSKLLSTPAELIGGLFKKGAANLFKGEAFKNLGANLFKGEAFKNLGANLFKGGKFKDIGANLFKGEAFKKILTTLGSKGSLGLAIAGAFAGVGTGLISITDAFNRQENLEKAQTNVNNKRDELELLEAALENAKASGDTKKIKEIESQRDAKQKELDTAINEKAIAEEKLTAGGEFAYNYEQKINAENTSLLEQRDKFREAQQNALNRGDFETAERFKRRADELTKQLEENRNKVKINTDFYRNSAFGNGLASLFNVFGLSEETMTGFADSMNNITNSFIKVKDNVVEFITVTIPNTVSKFIENIVEFVTVTIPNTVSKFIENIVNKVKGFFTVTLPTKIKEGVNYVVGKIRSFIQPVINLFNNIKLKITEFISPFVEYIDKNIIPKVTSFVELIRGVFDDLKDKLTSFINPVKEFFKFEWLPDIIKNFLFSGNKFNISTTSFANGGIVNQMTPSIVGEAGKEVILPLERPNALKNILSKLNNNEKMFLLKQIINGKNFSREGLITSLNTFLTSDHTFSSPSVRSFIESNSKSTNEDVSYPDVYKEKTKQINKPSVKSSGLLTDAELKTIAERAGVQNAKIMSEFINQASSLLNSGSNKDDIILILSEIAKLLKSNMNASKVQSVALSRPPKVAYT